MYVHFIGEPDDGIRPSSQLARALATLGVRTAFGDAPSWRSKRWREICRQADVIHVTAYCVRDQGLLRRLWLAKARGVALVRTWIGSDVLWALHHQRSMTFARRLQNLGVKQLAVADHLIDELATLGVQAEFVPIVAPQVVTGGAQIPPLPDVFTILCYLPARRRIFYGGPIVDDLIARMTDTNFIVIGDEPDRYAGASRVRVVPHAENCRPLIEASSVLIRPTLHDGTPRMMLEALALGRRVVTPWSYPHCEIARSAGEYFDVLNRLKAERSLHAAGQRHVHEFFAPSRTAAQFRTRLADYAEGNMSESAAGRWTGALAFAIRHLAMWKRDVSPLPTAGDLPPHAEALRSTLQ